MCLFIARILRTFWRYSMFYDATSICSKYNVQSLSTCMKNSTTTTTANNNNNGGLKSWVRNLIYTLSTVSTFGSGQSTSPSTEQIIISRLETSEITWLRNQIIYLQQFIERQLNVRGGWFQLLSLASASSATASASAASHHSFSTTVISGNI
ncbi:unnamed protein product, partial [Schistosoma turkestanicum]